MEILQAIFLNLRKYWKNQVCEFFRLLSPLFPPENQSIFGQPHYWYK